MNSPIVCAPTEEKGLERDSREEIRRPDDGWLCSQSQRKGRVHFLIKGTEKGPGSGRGQWEEAKVHGAQESRKQASPDYSQGGWNGPL